MRGRACKTRRAQSLFGVCHPNWLANRGFALRAIHIFFWTVEKRSRFCRVLELAAAAVAAAPTAAAVASPTSISFSAGFDRQAGRQAWRVQRLMPRRPLSRMILECVSDDASV